MNVHMVYNNENWDYNHEDLGLNENPTDREVITALAEQAGIPVAKLQGFVVSPPNETGDRTVSPRAIFGRSLTG